MSNNLNEKNVWLVGTGYMAIEYAKVLNALGVNFKVIGNGSVNANKFENEVGVKPFIGGLNAFLSTHPKLPDYVINAISVSGLFSSTKLLLSYGVKAILLEKPGAVRSDELQSLKNIAEVDKADIYIGYNRRFYSSVQNALAMIEQDGGVRSFNFEFTEWSHRIEKQDIEKEVAHEWIICNSSHVIDMAFFMGGWPKELKAFKSGSLSWHPAGAAFTGAGISESGALFSYRADWAAPGRWGVEILTGKRKLIFCPLEGLKEQLLGSIQVSDLNINDELDIEFKPGLFNQTKCFLTGVNEHLLSIAEHYHHVVNTYDVIKECK